MTAFARKKAGRPAAAILAAMLLSAPVAAQVSVGVARATGTTTVSLSVPPLYGVRLLEQDGNPAEPAGIRFASSGQAEAEAPGARLFVVSTAGEGRIALRRLVLDGGPSDMIFFPTTSFGWKNLEDRLSPARLARVSRSGSHAAPTVVYELWHF